MTGKGGEPRSFALAGRTTIGRDPEADVCIEDEAISWHHLEIEGRGGVLMATAAMAPPSTASRSTAPDASAAATC